MLWELLTGKVVHFLLSLLSYYTKIQTEIEVLFLQNFNNFHVFQVPYEYLTPLQAAVGVVQKVYRIYSLRQTMQFVFWFLLIILYLLRD
jgi:hypothetical protein